MTGKIVDFSPSSRLGIRSRCSVVIRGISKPLVVELMATLADGMAGVVASETERLPEISVLPLNLTVPFTSNLYPALAELLIATFPSLKIVNLFVLYPPAGAVHISIRAGQKSRQEFRPHRLQSWLL